MKPELQTAEKQFGALQAVQVPSSFKIMGEELLPGQEMKSAGQDIVELYKSLQYKRRTVTPRLTVF